MRIDYTAVQDEIESMEKEFQDMYFDMNKIHIEIYNKFKLEWRDRYNRAVEIMIMLLQEMKEGLEIPLKTIKEYEQYIIDNKDSTYRVLDAGLKLYMNGRTGFEFNEMIYPLFEKIVDYINRMTTMFDKDNQFNDVQECLLESVTEKYGEESALKFMENMQQRHTKEINTLWKDTISIK